jgi:polyphosphate kinase
VESELIDLKSPDNYVNRDLSVLAFHRRVLDMASDESLPLLERLRFLCISSSNLDEFFEVRVALQKHRIALGQAHPGADGLAPSEMLSQARPFVCDMVAEQYRVLNDILLPALAAEGVHFLRRHEWNEQQVAWIKRFFNRELLPVLTPIALDPAHPFPRLLNKILNFIVALEGKDAFGRDLQHAIVQAPRSLPRVIHLPREVAGPGDHYVFLSSILHAHVGALFPGMEATACHQFRVTRNSQLMVDEDEVLDLKKALASELLERGYSEAVRLEVSTKCPEELSDFLLHQFNLKQTDLYRVDGPVNLSRLAAVCEEVRRPDLKFASFTPSVPAQLRLEDGDLFAALRQGDVLLHHPFQSFAPVVNLLSQAADDPNVLAIKQTLYRVDVNSPIVDAMVRAARNHKEVVAVIELRARFNEEDNILLAERLSAAGAQVVYGVVGYKTHGKMMLIVRREARRIRRYVHLGTGNYHTITSRYYTDLGLLSCNTALGDDVHKIFQQLTGLGKASRLKEMLSGPFTLHKGLIQRIEREAGFAKAGGEAKIIAKMNGLEEPEIICALYRASQAGVKIDLIVRGICCLRPGIRGLSENIRVRSVLGRFLEHSRVFCFHNGGEEEVFCASADWMSRNLLRRVETCFPVLDAKLHRQVVADALRPYLANNACTWQMQSDGSYRRVAGRGSTKSAQDVLIDRLAL